MIAAPTALGFAVSNPVRPPRNGVCEGVSVVVSGSLAGPLEGFASHGFSLGYNFDQHAIELVAKSYMQDQGSLIMPKTQSYFARYMYNF